MRPREAAGGDEWVLELYSRRERSFEREADTRARRSVLISNARLLLFCGGIVALAAATWGERASIPLVMTGVAALLIFAGLVVVHARVDARRDRAAALAAVNRTQAARVRRDWERVPPADLTSPSPDHPYAQDLDLFGRASVAALIGPPATVHGRRVLRRWLLGPADPDTITLRQEAVRELAPLVDLRQQLQATGGPGLADEQALDAFLAWVEGEPSLITRPWLRWTIRLLTVLTVGSIALGAFGTIRTDVWPAFMLASLTLWFLLVGRTASVFDRAEAGERALLDYAELFRIAREPFRASRLAMLSARLVDGHVPADVSVRRLDRLLGFASLRRIVLFHAAINALTLWDLHVLAAVERWQADAGRHVRDWLEALGEIETLASLAALSHDNPDWSFAVVDRSARTIDATALGHPLIARRTRVPNDVTVGPPGTFLLVTGSNMSGKSTLIRAVGVNVVLAQAGGPVCAASLRLPPLAVFTSVHIQDSHAQGLSYFMAGLARLKRIVDRAPEASADSSQRLLYLLDEILQGTNTAERQIAVRAVLRRLLESPAIGAATTHDLALADDPDLRERAHPVHFTEIVGEGPAGIAFDYKLRPGIATSRNALRLMRLMGLDPGER